MVRCVSSSGAQPLDLGGLRQNVATGESVFDSNLVEQEPGNGSLVWGKGALTPWSSVCTFAQTELPSRECTHVARIAPSATTAALVLGSWGSGLGLKKWVMS